MRKLYSILLALTLSFVMLATAVSPVMAEPADNQPVAWVNFTGTGQGGPDNDPKAFTVRPNAQINVKRLADGSSVGHMELRFLEKDARYEIPYDVIDSSFGTDGNTKYADILAKCPNDMYWWWRIEDNGEPGGGNDAFAAYVYWPASWPSEVPTYPTDPLPTKLYNIFDPPSVPGWYIMLPHGHIAPDNIQVHITNDYIE